MYMSEHFYVALHVIYDYLTIFDETNALKATKQESFYIKDCLLHKNIVILQPIINTLLLGLKSPRTKYAEKRHRISNSNCS